MAECAADAADAAASAGMDGETVFYQQPCPVHRPDAAIHHNTVTELRERERERHEKGEREVGRGVI